MHVPAVYTGDGHFRMLSFQRFTEFGTYYWDPYTAAPHFVSGLEQYPVESHLHFWGIALIFWAIH